MNRQKWFWTITAASVLGVPLILFAYSSGAPARSTGAPGDNTCLRGGCHVGTRTDNSELLTISFAGGNSYTPGIRQRFTVRIGDTGRRYGFQATARPQSSEISGQAGTFTPIDSRTYVLCETVDPRPAIGCPPNNPIEFITHFDSSTSNTFEFDWTPPNTNVGPINIYVAANASNGPAPGGAKIHLKRLTLQPGVGSGFPPTISENGVTSAGAFGGGTTVAPGSWIEIFGRNLSNVSRSWEGRDFDGARAPTNLENVQVTIDGRPAAVAFVSPGQVNAQVPDGIATGAPIQVRLRTPGGEAGPITITGRGRAPGILAPAPFTRNNRQYVGALFPDGVTFAGLPNLVPGANFRLPRPGETIIIYGVGFGATSPAFPAGTIVSGTPRLEGVTIRIGNQTATASYAGLSPNFVGLYQFNVVVPNLQAGDHEIVMTVDGVSTQANLFLSTGN